VNKLLAAPGSRNRVASCYSPDWRKLLELFAHLAIEAIRVHILLGPLGQISRGSDTIN